MRDISLVKFLPKEPKVPFISARMIAGALSCLAIIASIFLFTTKGLNYGIDFTGGTVLEVDTGSQPPLDEIRVQLNGLGLGQPNLQTIDPPAGSGVDHQYVRITIPLQLEEAALEQQFEANVIEAAAEAEGDNLLINTQTTDDEGTIIYDVRVGDTPILQNVRDLDANVPWVKLDDFTAALRGQGLDNIEIEETGTRDGTFDVYRLSVPMKAESSANVQQLALGLVKINLGEVVGKFSIRNQGVVGSKVSGELRQKGILAILLALGMVLIYIWFRFEWQFAVGAVMALFHDVLLTIGVFSLTQLEFNLSIIAAILTIVGYSLNDTVIVYDRIRENLRKYKKMPLPDVLNLSINDTLSRTILTSMTTLLALVSLYILGGEGLRGFSFAMIWGVFVGTYSSIFVASPLLLLLKLKRGATEAS